MPRTYKPKPLTSKTCLACGSTFEGTPAATRCPTCRTNGVKVPKDKQAAQGSSKPRAEPKAPPKGAPQFHKTCHACHSEFTTHKAKAARCNSCISENRRVAKRTCLECKKPFTLLDEDHVNCPSCAEMHEIDQSEMTPDQIAQMRHEEHLKEHQERLEAQREWLTAREAKPKGYPKMPQRDLTRPLSILWVELCAADGAASSLMATTKADHGLSDTEKVTLLTTFYRFRCKGYHPSAIAKLCPQALLKEAAQEAIVATPEVTPSERKENHDYSDWGRIAQAAALGL